MTSTNNTYDDVTMVVADLDGTLLHDGETFEDRFLTQRSIDSINRMHDAGIKFVVETVRLRYAHLTDTAEGRTSAEDRILFEKGLRGLQVPAGGTA